MNPAPASERERDRFIQSLVAVLRWHFPHKMGIWDDYVSSTQAWLRENSFPVSSDFPESEIQPEYES